MANLEIRNTEIMRKVVELDFITLIPQRLNKKGLNNKHSKKEIYKEVELLIKETVESLVGEPEAGFKNCFGFTDKISISFLGEGCWNLKERMIFIKGKTEAGEEIRLFPIQCIISCKKDIETGWKISRVEFNKKLMDIPEESLYSMLHSKCVRLKTIEMQGQEIIIAEEEALKEIQKAVYKWGKKDDENIKKLVKIFERDIKHSYFTRNGKPEIITVGIDEGQLSIDCGIWNFMTIKYSQGEDKRMAMANAYCTEIEKVLDIKEAVIVNYFY